MIKLPEQLNICGIPNIAIYLKYNQTHVRSKADRGVAIVSQQMQNEETSHFNANPKTINLTGPFDRTVIQILLSIHSFILILWQSQYSIIISLPKHSRIIFSFEAYFRQ